MSILERVDGYQRAHKRAGFPLAVLYKFFDDGGGQLAALLTYYGLLSLFPLLLLASTVLGLVLAGDPGAQQHVLHSALSQFPVIGQQLQEPKSLGGGPAGIVIGVVGALAGGMGISNAVQTAMNTIWTVPKNKRPNPLKLRVRGLGLLIIGGVVIVATTFLSALANGLGAYGGTARLLAVISSLVVNAAGFAVGFKLATTRDVDWRDVVPGAVSAAVLWQLLQTFGATYVGHVVKNASGTNSVFALVLGLIAFLYLASLAVVLSAEGNAVRVDRLYPRALLTPFTDDVDLTEGDERSYTDQATAQRHKGFQHITVDFDNEKTP